MFGRKKLFEDLVTKLGWHMDYDWKHVSYYEGRDACSPTSIAILHQKIQETNERLVMLYAYLGVQEQKLCSENLPKLIKKIKK